MAEEREDYVSKLIAALGHEEPETSVRAAWILGELREARAAGPLMRLVERSSDPYILGAAVEALGRIGDPQAASILTQVLGSSFLLVRQEAAEALGRLGGEEAERALAVALADPNVSVREAASRALQTLGHLP